MAFIEDPRKGVKERMGEITRQEPDMDAQELAEREEAAQAYAGENEKHFVDYLEDCVTTSMNANDEVRQVQDECWRLWNEEEPANYADKEAWQSRVVLPMPHASVLFAMSLIRKAFDVQFLSIENERNQDGGRLSQKTDDHSAVPNLLQFPAPILRRLRHVLRGGHQHGNDPDVPQGEGPQVSCLSSRGKSTGTRTPLPGSRSRGSTGFIPSIWTTGS